MSGSGPTLSGFAAWTQTAMGVPAPVITASYQFVTWAYEIAIDIVSLDLNLASQAVYTLAVYNLGGSNLINYGQDLAPPPNATYFADIRAKWKINSFVPGLIQSTGDASTSESLMIPETLKNLTLAELQYLKDPWGRTYLGFAQRYGSNLWGLS